MKKKKTVGIVPKQRAGIGPKLKYDCLARLYLNLPAILREQN